MTEHCPACPGGRVDVSTRTCNRCGVAVPRTSPDLPTRSRRPWRCRPDQDHVSAGVDYARTKEDKQ